MSAEKTVQIFKKLDSGDFRTLLAIELGMGSYEYVPTAEIIRFSELPSAKVDFHLKHLHSFGLIQRWVGPYSGYVLNTAGYDCLAINAAVKANVLEALGKPIGVGKESDVYDALTPKGNRVAAKFHRLGRISFRQTRRARGYIAERRHISWLYQSRLAAENEFQALLQLYPKEVSVPKPIFQNRHLVVMGLIKGAPLSEYMRVPNPKSVLHEILRNVRQAYVKAGVVHADLSEFNIIIKPDGRLLIIDWPQYVTRDHPNVDFLLQRDVQNTLSYFRRKFKVELQIERVLEYVKGKINNI
jgi:RIO kinase 2